MVVPSGGWDVGVERFKNKGKRLIRINIGPQHIVLYWYLLAMGCIGLQVIGNERLRGLEKGLKTLIFNNL